MAATCTVGAVDMQNLDAVDLFHRAHALSHDAFDAFEQFFTEARGTRRIGEQVFRLVQLGATFGVNLITCRGSESLDLVGGGLALRGDPDSLGKTRRRSLF